jgi:DNA (cytosine-5)-methyltransferase 1
MKPFIYNLDFVKEQSKKELFTVVSLFAGAGGSSTGYRLAGGKVLAVNEFIPAAYECYHQNYPETLIFKQDIRKLDGETILKGIGLKKGELDVLDGSPPCSSFSMAGKREKGWGKEKKYSDTIQRTDDLFFEYARILKDIMPRVFIAENVKGITMGEASNMLGDEQYNLFGGEEKTIFNTLIACGYDVRYKVLNAKDYGVPQSRERTIFIGIRKDINASITYPKEIDREYITLFSVFEGLINTKEELDECNIDKYAIGEELKKLKEGEQSIKYFSLCKQDRNRYSDTLTQTAGVPSAASIAHWDNRKFTVSEAKRICSFPDNYFVGIKYQQKIERLGRAVPPLMMKAIAEHVYNTILKNKQEIEFK